MLLVWVFTCLVLIFLSKLLHEKWRILYYSFKIPGPPAIPLVASFFLVTIPKKGIINVFKEKWRSYYPLCKWWVGTEFYIFTSRPQDVETVLTTFLEKSNAYKFIDDGAKNSLLTADVSLWKVNRKLLNPTFHLQILNSFQELHVKYSARLVNNLESTAGSEQTDVLTKIWKTTLDNIIATVGCTEPSLLRGRDDLIQAVTTFGDIFIQRVYKFWLLINFFWKSSTLFKKVAISNAQGRILPNDALKFVQKAYEAKHYENDPIKEKCFLPRLVKLSNETNALSSDHIVEETIAMFIAGSESSSVAVTSALMFLGTHPNVQDKVYDEIISVLGSSDTDPTLEDINRLDLVERVLKETMRLSPPIPVISRYIDKDIISDSYVYPAGSNIVIPIMYLHCDPNVWPDPKKFDPDRFLPEEVEKRHRCSYIPFSFGSRNCIGFKYAMMSTKVYLTMIVKKLKVKTVEPKSMDEIEWEHFIIMRPKNVRLVFEKRQ